ncbi:capsule biosynthesis GfcC family protein [Vibrio paracholerae]|uniref:capsule biosynthesis GfcC family protein n=1 Tax=Vibrio paracholerae TaxID=650003 RepID=UPI002095E2E9|nr:capsule biosynthesis GfcC family protein [Vibrio paracholerae]MCO7030113.1 capsule biosynthesis GfcC family protein [Vibrio paracholerae]
MRFISLLSFLGCLGVSLTLHAKEPISHTDFSAKVAISHSPLLIKLEADGTVRLDAMVLQALHSQQPAISTLRIDWQNSRLFSLHAPFPLQKNLLKTLAELQDKIQEPQATGWQQLRNELRKRNFAKRAFIPLDPDVIRTVSGHNPLLNGEFALYLPYLSDSQTVTVLGAVHHSEPQPWKATLSARDYAQQAKWINSTLGELTVIQPTGEVQTHPIGYWNAKPLTILPGAMIYVPFTTSLFSSIDHTTLEHINQQVVELLRHQLPRE